jgi:hypothetical protein
MLRGNGQLNPDGVRDYDLLVPLSVEALTIERHSAARESWLREADSWRASLGGPVDATDDAPG